MYTNDLHETSYKINNLVPGQSYVFFVLAYKHGRWTPGLEKFFLHVTLAPGPKADAVGGDGLVKIE